MSSSGALKKFDDMIRRGEGRQVRAELRKIGSSPVSRSLASQIAALARRCNLPSVALKVLYPVVRNPDGSEATQSEIAEYAAALTYIGASAEALVLLKSVNPKELPEADLYISFALFARWEYERALPHLTRYIKSEKISDYQRLVGYVNLIAALVYVEQHEKAEEIIETVLAGTTAPEFSFLRGNALELAAQNAIQRGLFNTGDRYLLESQALLSRAGGLFEFFTRKWRALNQVLRCEGDEDSMEELRKIRFEAKKHMHWETARDCDRFEAIAKKDVKLAQHVYFGTPYKSFRARLLKDFGPGLILPEIYFWSFLPGALPDEVIDVAAGTVARRASDNGEVRTLENSLTPGESCYRLLNALTADFYSPLRLPVIFGKIFPGEPYHPKTSSARTFRVIQKLRLWLEENKVPLTIEEESGFYRPQSEARLAIKIVKEKPVL